MYHPFVPKEIFLTKGIGRHREKLASFEEALRSAKIANFNLVPVSSIFPPNCKVVSVGRGLEQMKSGQVVHCVISRNAVDENHRSFPPPSAWPFQKTEASTATFPSITASESLRI